MDSVSSSPRVERLVGNIKGRSPQFFKIMDQLTSKFGKEHTQLINNVIIREINKNQGSRKAALMDTDQIEAAVIEHIDKLSYSLTVSPDGSRSPQIHQSSVNKKSLGLSLGKPKINPIKINPATPQRSTVKISTDQNLSPSFLPNSARCYPTTTSKRDTDRYTTDQRYQTDPTPQWDLQKNVKPLKLKKLVCSTALTAPYLPMTPASPQLSEGRFMVNSQTTLDPHSTNANATNLMQMLHTNQQQQAMYNQTAQNFFNQVPLTASPETTARRVINDPQLNQSLRTSQQVLEDSSYLKEQLKKYHNDSTLMRLASEGTSFRSPRMSRAMQSNERKEAGDQQMVEKQIEQNTKAGPAQRDEHAYIKRPQTDNVTMWDYLVLQDTVRKKLEDQEQARQTQEKMIQMREFYQTQIIEKHNHKMNELDQHVQDRDKLVRKHVDENIQADEVYKTKRSRLINLANHNRLESLGKTFNDQKTHQMNNQTVHQKLKKADADFNIQRKEQKQQDQLTKKIVLDEMQRTIQQQSKHRQDSKHQEKETHLKNLQILRNGDNKRSHDLENHKAFIQFRDQTIYNTFSSPRYVTQAKLEVAKDQHVNQLAEALNRKEQARIEKDNTNRRMQYQKLHLDMLDANQMQKNFKETRGVMDSVTRAKEMALFNMPVTANVPWARSGSETIQNGTNTFPSRQTSNGSSPMHRGIDSPQNEGFKTMRTTLQAVRHQQDMQKKRNDELKVKNQLRKDLQQQRINNFIEKEKQRLYLSKNELATSGNLMKELPLTVLQKKQPGMQVGHSDNRNTTNGFAQVQMLHQDAANLAQTMTKLQKDCQIYRTIH